MWQVIKYKLRLLSIEVIENKRDKFIEHFVLMVQLEKGSGEISLAKQNKL